VSTIRFIHAVIDPHTALANVERSMLVLVEADWVVGLLVLLQPYKRRTPATTSALRPRRVATSKG
jgi:hypothetical protein